MNDLVQTPAKGQKLRISWGAAVSDAVNRHERALSSSAEPSPENRRGSIPPPHPFFVAGGEDQGSARFVIYLPAGCLVCGSTVLVPEAGLTALQGAADRYVIPAANLGQLGATAAAAATLYVVAYRTSGTNSSVVADVTTNLSSVPSDATTLLALPVARIFAGAHGGGSYGCVAAQYVRSSVEITEGGGGSGSGTSQSVTVVTDIALKEVSTGVYKLQKKTQQLTFTGSLGTETAWTDVFDTVPHSNNPIV